MAQPAPTTYRCAVAAHLLSSDGSINTGRSMTDLTLVTYTSEGYIQSGQYGSDISRFDLLLRAAQKFNSKRSLNTESGLAPSTEISQGSSHEDQASAETDLSEQNPTANKGGEVATAQPDQWDAITARSRLDRIAWEIGKRTGPLIGPRNDSIHQAWCGAEHLMELIIKWSQEWQSLFFGPDAKPETNENEEESVAVCDLLRLISLQKAMVKEVREANLKATLWAVAAGHYPELERVPNVDEVQLIRKALGELIAERG